MQREAEELVADWSSDLEAVLYHPEVEEAIREVRMLDHSSPSPLAETGMLQRLPAPFLLRLPGVPDLRPSGQQRLRSN